ncbi:hypothetical protein PO909_022310 [Leuciscus waleckii]
MNLSYVPAEYLDLKEVFSKSRAASLPLHRPYDCAIDLLPGYIVSSEGVRLDPDKVKAVIDWPSQDSRKGLQRFLGFANFYQRFIRNFSQLSQLSQVIRWGHCSNVACHPGVNRTSCLVKQRFWWPLMARDIHSFVLACSVCAIGKTSNRPPDGLLQPLSVPSRAWSHIALDFVTTLPPSNGMTVVLTVVDPFSKAAHFIPLPKLPSSKETAVTVVDHVFRLHGLPMDVVSDRWSQFVSKFWEEFCTRSYSQSVFGLSSPEQWSNRTSQPRLGESVASSWSQQLSMVEYAHISLPVSSTGLSPFECSLGYQPPIFPSLESEVAVPSAHAFVQRCHHTWTRARETLLQLGARTKAKADCHRSRPPVYVVGQKVWLSTKNIPLRSVSNKLAPKLIGPFTVTNILSPVAVRLKLPPPRFPPPPRLVDGETTYSVNRILYSRQRGRGFQYLVDWEGYGPEERSWVPARDILDHSLIDDYNQQIPFNYFGKTKQAR